MIESLLREQVSNADVFPGGLTDILGKLRYYTSGPTNLNGDAYKIDFFKGVETDSLYPRFHMVLESLVGTSRITIESFHMDERPHKSLTILSRRNLDRKNGELEALVKQLKNEKVSAARDVLLLLLNSELLFGSARDINVIKGVKQEERFVDLFLSRKRKKGLQVSRKVFRNTKLILRRNILREQSFEREHRLIA